MPGLAIKRKNILFNFMIILGLVAIFQFSIFRYLNELIHTSIDGLPDLSVNVMIFFILALNLVSISISIVITGLLAYFFGKIFDAGASKKTFIYIVSTANIIIYLINIPLAISNFMNHDPSQVVLLNRPLYIFLNPLIYISLYVFYKLLRKYTRLTPKIIIGYCIIFYLLKLSGIVVSHIQML